MFKTQFKLLLVLSFSVFTWGKDTNKIQEFAEVYLDTYCVNKTKYYRLYLSDQQLSQQ